MICDDGGVRVPLLRLLSALALACAGLVLADDQVIVTCSPTAASAASQ